jgi:hypothetical protein
VQKHIVIPGYYATADIISIVKAETFEELRDIALAITARMVQPVSMVCGPITSGGKSKEDNIRIFCETIAELDGKGVSVFSQMPFESAMWRIVATPYYEGGNHLLETFYLPLFGLGRIKKLYFIPGWSASVGASWEHEQAGRFNIEIYYLPDGKMSAMDELLEQIKLAPLDDAQKQLAIRGALKLSPGEAREMAGKLKDFYAKLPLISEILGDTLKKRGH